MGDLRDTLSATVLPIYRKVLRWAVIVFTEYYILWTLMQYIVWDLPFQKFGKRVGLTIIVATLIYLILSAFADPARLKPVIRLMKKYCTFEQIFLITLFFWYILVCCVRINMDGAPYFKHNDNRLFIVWMSAFIFFPFVELMGMKYARRVIEGLAHVTTAIYTPFCMWALAMYFSSQIVVLPSGNSITTYGGSSLMIGSHKNITGAVAAVILALCIYMIAVKHRWIRLLYIAAAAVHALVLVLSDARASFLSSLCLVIAAVVIGVWDKIKGRFALSGKSGRNLFKIVAGVAIAMVCVLLLINLRKWIMAMSANALDKTGTMKVRDFTDLSGRQWIWRAALLVMSANKENFFFGVTPAHVVSALFNTGIIGKTTQPHAHNVILQVGVALGVPAMILYTAFLVLLCIRGVRIIRAKIEPVQGKRIPKIWVVPLIVMFLIMIDLAEVMIFATNRVNLPIFYIFAGWVVAYDRRNNGPVRIRPLAGLFKRLIPVKQQ